MDKKDKINILKGVLVVFIYFWTSLSNLRISILNTFNIDYNNWSNMAKYIYLILYQFVVVGIIIAVFWKTYKEHFIKFKNNFKAYISGYIKYWFLALGLMMISNIFIQMIASEIAQNEQAVRSQLYMEPLYTFIASVIIAPFLEESIFRLSIRKIIPKHKWAYILISGISFGFLHVLDSLLIIIEASTIAGHLVLTGYTDLLYIIPYSIPGCIFAYTLVKSNNIFVPISLHTIHNGILVTIQLLLM